MLVCTKEGPGGMLKIFVKFLELYLCITVPGILSLSLAEKRNQVSSGVCAPCVVVGLSSVSIYSN